MNGRWDSIILNGSKFAPDWIGECVFSCDFGWGFSQSLDQGHWATQWILWLPDPPEVTLLWYGMGSMKWFAIRTSHSLSSLSSFLPVPKHWRCKVCLCLLALWSPGARRKGECKMGSAILGFNYSKMKCHNSDILGYKNLNMIFDDIWIPLGLSENGGFTWIYLPFLWIYVFLKWPLTMIDHDWPGGLNFQTKSIGFVWGKKHHLTPSWWDEGICLRLLTFFPRHHWVTGFDLESKEKICSQDCCSLKEKRLRPCGMPYNNHIIIMENYPKLSYHKTKYTTKLYKNSIWKYMKYSPSTRIASPHKDHLLKNVLTLGPNLNPIQ